MIIRYAEEKNFIELRQFYDGMCKVLSADKAASKEAII